MEGRVNPKSQTEADRTDTDWGSLTWLASKALGGIDTTLGRVVLRKGKTNPRHCHDTCDEVLYVLKGKLEHSLGEESFTLEAGDTILIPAGVFHGAASVGDEDADVIVSYTSGERDYREEKPS